MTDEASTSFCSTVFRCSGTPLPFAAIVVSILWYLNLSSGEITISDLYGLPIMAGVGVLGVGAALLRS